MFLLGIHVNIHSGPTVSPLHLILSPNHHRFTFHVPEENVLDQKKKNWNWRDKAPKCEASNSIAWAVDCSAVNENCETWLLRFFMGMTKDEVHFDATFYSSTQTGHMEPEWMNVSKMLRTLYFTQNRNWEHSSSSHSDKKSC